MKLDAAELASRLQYDLEVVSELRSPALGEIRAYASDDDWRAGRRLDASNTGERQATVYVVDYSFPVLVSAAETTPKVTVHFDLLAGGNYPYTAPWTAAVSRPTPWSPHVHPNEATVCIGEIWRDARGKMLLADLIVHVMRILNFDETERGLEYGGWNSAAINHWRRVLKRKPLHPDLAYPVLPTHLTHGMPEPDCSFSPVSCDETLSGFAPSSPSTQRRIAIEDVLGDAFTPIRTR